MLQGEEAVRILSIWLCLPEWSTASVRISFKFRSTHLQGSQTIVFYAVYTPIKINLTHVMKIKK